MTPLKRKGAGKEFFASPLRVPTAFSLTLALLSGAGILLEIALTRLFSTLFFPPYVFAIISVAVLGIGLGAALATAKPAWRSPKRLPLYVALAGYATQLGKWFKEGQELSGGQWQKIALARAFMRTEADILVLDEPTAAMDAAAEATIFEHFRQLTRNRIAILISHRFSTVRMASRIIVIEGGHIIEHGSHEQLMELGGHYANLFSLQAAGYQ